MLIFPQPSVVLDLYWVDLHPSARRSLLVESIVMNLSKILPCSLIILWAISPSPVRGDERDCVKAFALKANTALNEHRPLSQDEIQFGKDCKNTTGYNTATSAADAAAIDKISADFSGKIPEHLVDEVSKQSAESMAPPIDTVTIAPPAGDATHTAQKSDY